MWVPAKDQLALIRSRVAEWACLFGAEWLDEHDTWLDEHDTWLDEHDTGLQYVWPVSVYLTVNQTKWALLPRIPQPH